MASKVMVKIPVTPFVQVNKSKTTNGSDLVTIGRSQPESANRDADPSAVSVSTSKTNESSRVAQLEQNIRFLQEQHQTMLAGLHREIDNLRHCNRELQFQLVFAKSNNAGIPSPTTSSSSSEDDLKHKSFASPKQINVTPLQVELLERELGELKVHMQDLTSRNVYLSAIVDEQKKKLERYERDRERERGLPPDTELLRKLDDAESLIRRMRRENEDLRREHSQAGGSGGGSSNYQPRGGPNQRGGGGRYHRGNNYRGGGGGGGGSSGNNRFPPLHSQNYWQSNRGDSADQSGVGGTLPILQQQQNGGGGSGQQMGNQQHQQGNQYQSRRTGNNNQYHHQGGDGGGGGGGGGRKYRGGQHRGPKPSS